MQTPNVDKALWLILTRRDRDRDQDQGEYRERVWHNRNNGSWSPSHTSVNISWSSIRTHWSHSRCKVGISPLLPPYMVMLRIFRENFPKISRKNPGTYKVRTGLFPCSVNVPLHLGGKKRDVTFILMMYTIDTKISQNFQEKEVTPQRSDCKAKSVVWKPTPLKYQTISGINRNKSTQEKILYKAIDFFVNNQQHPFSLS